MATEGYLNDAWSYFSNWRGNAGRAVTQTFTSLTIKDYIRLVWIIGGYCFLRPYLEAGFRKLFESGRAKEERKKAEEDAAAEAVIAEKVAKGEIPAKAADLGEWAEQDDELEADKSVPQWGRGARLRQRKAMQLMEQHMQRLKDEDDDKDIEEFLVD